MKTMTAVEARTNFDKFLDTAQQEPVIVTRENHPVGVMLSIRDIEDTIFGEQALKAHTEGYIGEGESTHLLDKLLNAQD